MWQVAAEGVVPLPPELVQFLRAQPPRSTSRSSDWHFIDAMVDVGVWNDCRDTLAAILREIHPSDDESYRNWCSHKLGNAALHGSCGAAQALLQAKADVDAACDFPQSCFISAVACAAEKGYADVVSLLIEARADVVSADHRYRTPLSYAAAQGQASTLQLLLSAKAPVDGAGGGDSPLRHAVRHGSTSCVTRLLEANADVNVSPCFGHTPLGEAAHFGHADIIGMLLEAKADATHADSDGRTCLFVAAEKGRTACVQVLVAAKADVHVLDNRGRSPAEYAGKGGYVDVVSALAGAKADVARGSTACLFYAAREGLSCLVAGLVQAKASVRGCDDSGHTAIYSAARNGHKFTVRQLVLAKADIDELDRDGCTAVVKAARESHKSTVALLLEAKATPHILQK
jgi:ankyrin repeat protein